MRSRYVIQIDTFHLVLPTLLQGMPMAMFFVPLTAIILAGQPSQRISDIFYVSAIIFVMIIPLIWITRPVKGGVGSDAAGAH
jgi:hypothetical protein